MCIDGCFVLAIVKEDWMVKDWLRGFSEVLKHKEKLK